MCYESRKVEQKQMFCAKNAECTYASQKPGNASPHGTTEKQFVVLASFFYPKKGAVLSIYFLRNYSWVFYL